MHCPGYAHGMTKKSPSKTIRIVVESSFYEAFKRACHEDGMTISAGGRRFLVRALRARARDKTLLGLPEEPTTGGVK